MFLIVGLGNPGKEYEFTRHNIGFRVLSAWADKNNFSFEFEKTFKAEICKTDICGQKVILIKPQTFMNLSGQAVVSTANFYKIPPQNILVISDDFSLPLGTMRMREKGSSGGQKGLENIINCLGTNIFPRLRLGIAPQYVRGEAKNFVLGRFSNQEEQILAPTLKKAVQALEMFLTDGFLSAQQFANTL